MDPLEQTQDRIYNNQDKFLKPVSIALYSSSKKNSLEEKKDNYKNKVVLK